MAGSMGASVPAAAQSHMELRFTWRGVAACSHAPPEFVITGVPAGTSVLRFELQDLQAPNYHHGGGIVRYQGSPAIRAGAFRYNGPCPPPGTRHAYRWTVHALGTGGQVLVGDQRHPGFSTALAGRPLATGIKSAYLSVMMQCSEIVACPSLVGSEPSHA